MDHFALKDREVGIERPASPPEPVIVTVTATDPATGRVLGKSSISFDWDGDFAVVVRETG